MTIMFMRSAASLQVCVVVTVFTINVCEVDGSVKLKVVVNEHDDWYGLGRSVNMRRVDKWYGVCAQQ